MDLSLLSLDVQSIHQWFEAQVEQSPDTIALIFENQNLSYAELNHRSNQLAHELRSFGVESDHLVGVFLDRSFEMVIGLLGILKAGGAYVPLDPSYPAERLDFILADAQVDVILTQSSLLEKLPPQAAKIVLLDRDWGGAVGNPNYPSQPEDLMYVIYTSGSTGQPKGVMISHANIHNQLRWRQTTFPLKSGDRVLQNISFSFDPSVWQIFWPLCCGATLVLPRPRGQQEPRYLIELIARSQVTVIAVVPSLLRVLLEEPGIGQLASLRHVFCGGEVLPLAVQQRFFQQLKLAQLHNVYGPTEAAIDATYWTCSAEAIEATAPLGHAIDNAQTYLLDQDLQPVTEGELHIGGAGLARGYLNQPELTAEKFIASPWGRLYKTGDWARIRQDGTLEFIGRLDQQVKVRGFRIELGEIETVLQQHPAVQQSVVLKGDRGLIAYVVPSLSSTLLRQFLATKLPDYMIPTAFVQLEALPLSPNGKVDRQALLHLPLQRQPHVSPQNEIEHQVLQIWQDVLQNPAIGVQDHFFELGGDSLLGAQVLAQIDSRLGQQVSYAMLVQSPTVQQFAAALRQGKSQANWTSIVQIQAGQQPALFCIHTIDGTIPEYYRLARHLRDRAIYAIQPRLIDGQPLIHIRVEDMAADYVRILQTVQPEGPYCLAGYSFGGLVAYEMARQLELQGQTVALLALLDTYNCADDWFKPLPLHRRLQQHWQHLRQRKFAYLKQRAVSKLQAPAARALWAGDLFTAVNLELKRTYYPQPYAGQVMLFRGTCPLGGERWQWYQPVVRDRQMGWAAIASQLEIHEVQAHHFNLMAEPHVQAIATVLNARLDLVNLVQ
jgi:amino acid adenylation domain-containing protein